MAFAEKDRLFTEFRGTLTENYILQSMKPYSVVTPLPEISLPMFKTPKNG
jgi:hypothetical protein